MQTKLNQAITFLSIAVGAVLSFAVGASIAYAFLTGGR